MLKFLKALFKSKEKVKSSISFNLDNDNNIDISINFKDNNTDIDTNLAKLLYVINKGLLIDAIADKLVQISKNSPSNQDKNIIDGVIKHWNYLYTIEKIDDPLIKPLNAFNQNNNK